MSSPTGSGNETATSFDLRDYLLILRRRKIVVIVAVLVTVGTAVLSIFLQTKVYESEARVLVQPDPSASLFGGATSSSSDAQLDATTEVQIVKSAPVAALVRKSIGSEPGISAGVIAGTAVLSIRARNTSASAAAEIADAYANAYLSLKRTRAVDGLIAASAQVEAKVAGIESQIQALDAQVAAAAPARQGAVAQDVAAQRDALVAQQGTFKETLDQLQVRSALDTGGVELVTPATVASTPVEPRPYRSIALALVLGLVLGIAVAFGVDFLDDSIKTVEDLERATEGVPAIATIPSFGESRDRAGIVVTFGRQTSPAAEAFRSLRTSVQFMGLDTPIRVVQITSANAAEGKTTTVANLGVAIASTGKRVVIIDLDLRRPQLHEVFKLDGEKGFTSVLLGQVELEEALQTLPGTQGLVRVLPAGPVPANPSELLSSPRVEKLIGMIREHADIVLLDSAPVLPVTDALVVSRCADAVLLVALSGVTTRRGAQQAAALLQQVVAPLRGTVLNGASARNSYGYGYGYGYTSNNGDGAKASTETESPSFAGRSQSSD